MKINYLISVANKYIEKDPNSYQAISGFIKYIQLHNTHDKQFKAGNKYRIQPKYTEKDLSKIDRLLSNNTQPSKIVSIISKTRPDVSTRTIYRWIKLVIDKRDKT